MANQEIKNNEQGIHDHGALNGNTNNDRDIADKKAISDLDKKGNPEDAQLFKDKLLGKNLENQNRISRFSDNQADDVNNRYAHGNVESRDPNAQQVAGNVILDSIQAQRISQAASEKAAAAIRDVGVQVAERIIATNEALNAKQEVRITIQNNILKDTEVFISKDGKQINVNFVTGASESAAILNQRSGELRSQLMENLKDVDYVEVNVEDQSGQNDNDQENGGNSRNQDNQQNEQEDN